MCKILHFHLYTIVTQQRGRTDGRQNIAKFDRKLSKRRYNPPVGNNKSLMRHERDRDVIYQPQVFDILNVIFVYDN